MTSEKVAPFPAAFTARAAAGVPAWSFAVVVIVAGTAAHAALHHHARGVWSPTQIGLAFFLVVNVLINFWELGLWFTVDAIKGEYESFRDGARGREADVANAFFLQRIPALSLLSFRRWTGVWSTYALFDPGYVDRGAFGYNIDVANGVTTLVPATLFAFGMTYDLMPARVLGIIGVAMFWQMFFGTVVYFFQFFNAGRHVGHTTKNLVLFVGCTNGLWLIFAPWGLWVSVQLVLTDTFAPFL